MNGSIFVFSRDVDGDAGERFRQVVTVFAEDRRAAERLLNHDFAEIRRLSSRPERPYAHEPRWTLEEVALDRERIVTALLTYGAAAHH